MLEPWHHRQSAYRRIHTISLSHTIVSIALVACMQRRTYLEKLVELAQPREDKVNELPTLPACNSEPDVEAIHALHTGQTRHRVETR